MKKITLFLALVFCAISLDLSAQNIRYTKDGRHYYIVSPNGRYFTGTVNEGPGCFYDFEEDKHYVAETDSIAVYAVTNDGIVCGSCNGFPAVWVRGGEWQKITALDSIGGKLVTGGEICGISADATKFITLMYYGEGKKMPVYFELDKFENWNDEEAWTFSSLPTPGREDLLYNMDPQFIQVCGMNYDGTRILGRYRLKDGKREVPFIWQRGEDGKWAVNFVAERCLFVEEVSNGDIEIPNRDEYEGPLDEFDAFRLSVETGIIYDLSPYSLFAWTGNGRYIPVSANVVNEDGMSDTFHAAVIDVDKDTLVIFDKVADAGSVSVNDKGEVFIYTPQTAYFRNSYVSHVDNPDSVVSLLEYTKLRSNGLIDLAEHMTYARDKDAQGNLIYKVGTGSAIWANEGNGFVTFNYDEANEMQIPQCFMVRFDAPVAVEKVEAEQLAVYPNPTSGMLYFENQLANVAIYDIAGRQVYSQSMAEESIDLSSLNAGTYVLVAQSKGENIVAKVMVTR